VYNKNKESVKWPGPICPKIKKKVEKFAELASICYVTPAGEGIFKVDSQGRAYIVDLMTQTCTCRRWDISGIPCHHSIACFRHEKITPEDMVSPWYSIDSFKRAYSNIIRPCRDRREWQKTYGINVDPPAYDKKVGRPSKNRRKAPHELEHHMGGKKMSRHGVIMHCSYCGGPGHNIGGCNDKKNGMPPKQYVSKKKKEVVRLLPDSSDEDEPVITQVIVMSSCHKFLHLSSPTNMYALYIKGSQHGMSIWVEQ
jgi:hypothetical protein